MMKKIVSLSLGMTLFLISTSSWAQNTPSTPKIQTSIGSGLFGIDSYEYHGGDCPINETFRPSIQLVAQYRITKNISFGIKSSWYRTVHNYSAYAATGLLGDDGYEFCFKEFHNVYAFGPEIRFIILARHRFTIQPAFYIQHADQNLYKTLKSINHGEFEPSAQRMDYENKDFRIFGTSLTLAYQITPKFGLAVTGALQNGGDEFGAIYGGTLDMSWNFNLKKPDGN